MNLIKKLSVYLLCVMIAIGPAGCQAYEDATKNLYVTTKDQLVDNAPTDSYAPTNLEKLSPSLQKKFEGKEVVVADISVIKHDSTGAVVGIPLDPASAGDSGSVWGGIASFAFGIAKGFVPGLAAFESLGVLLSSRKRQHYGEAITALNPMVEGGIDLKGAAVSVSKALGFVHTDAGSEQTVAVAPTPTPVVTLKETKPPA